MKIKAENLFMIDDKIIQLRGLYALWMGLFVTTVTILLYDSTYDTSRDFAMLSIGIASIYPCIMTANNIYGNGQTSTFLMIGCSFHQYLYWILFAYFQPSNILGRHPIGIMNWVWCSITLPFTCNMILQTWWLIFNKDAYKQYIIHEHEHEHEHEAVNQN